MQASSAPHKPDLSVVVVVYNIPREAPRTLYSLSADYQRHISPDDYEIIVVDNGSMPPVDAKMVAALRGNFRLIRLDPASPSPAQAINRGIAEARGNVIGVMIDGARIVTPGFLHFARAGVRLYPRAIVPTQGWYLGLDQQRWAMQAGYNQEREDKLLASIAWPDDGYRLFEIGTPDEPSLDAWFGKIYESNGLFLRREAWELLGGVEERFESAGGGFLNHDTMARALELPDREVVFLLGEGTFHQLHGGIGTNTDPVTIRQFAEKWLAEYESIRKQPQVREVGERTYLGVLPPAALLHFARAIVEPAGRPPLGATFDRALWSLAPSPRPTNSTAAALLDLAENELRERRFAASTAVARMARGVAPDEPAPQRLAAMVNPWLLVWELLGQGADHTEFHLALGRAHLLLGDSVAAKSEFGKALVHNANAAYAHLGLAHLKFPGENYVRWLERLHAALSPETYLEIGVDKGRSLAVASPPTRAIAVDPKPAISEQFKAETHFYLETSEEFFAKGRLKSLLGEGALDLAFIDGAHLFEQTLRDFINIETYCNARSVILLHDTVPLDEPTQQRTQTTEFYTGDVWKTVLCLKHYRPDLEIFTISTMPSGLTIILGLDPTSQVLAGHYDEAVKRFIDIPYPAIANRLHEELNVVANDWQIAEHRLKARGSLRSVTI